MSRLELKMAIAVVLALSACKDGVTEPGKRAEIRLTRGPAGRIAIEVIKGPTAIRAAQVELAVAGTPAQVLEDAQPPPGIPLDTVRMQVNSPVRAILFIGDERGMMLPRSGVIATFAANVPAGGAVPGAQVSISKALVVDASGTAIDATIGPALSLR